MAQLSSGGIAGKNEISVAGGGREGGNTIWRAVGGITQGIEAQLGGGDSASKTGKVGGLQLRGGRGERRGGGDIGSRQV